MIQQRFDHIATITCIMNSPTTTLPWRAISSSDALIFSTDGWAVGGWLDRVPRNFVHSGERDLYSQLLFEWSMYFQHTLFPKFSCPFYFRACNFRAPPKFHFSRLLIFAHQIHFAPLLFSHTLNFMIFNEILVFCSFEIFSINSGFFGKR